MPAHDLTYIATYTQIELSVKFYDGDTLLKEDIVLYGESAIPPSDPEKVGYTFTGWSASFLNVQSSIDIYAEWMINTYTVTFDGDGGTLISGDEVRTIEHGSPATAPVYEKEGFDLSWDRTFNSQSLVI